MKKPLHIAIDARVISSGTGRYVERLLTHLEQLDSHHHYSVLVRKKDEEYWKPTKPNFSVVVADFDDYSFDEQLGLYYFLKGLGPDLVHFCMPQQPLLYRRPSVTTIHDLTLLRIDGNDMNPAELKIKQAIFAGLLRIVTKRTKHIITISKHSKKDILRFSKVKPNKVSVTYPAAEKLSAKSKKVSSLENKDFIMYVGRAETYKNNRRLIKAHQRLLKKHADLRLVIVGKIDDLRQADVDWVKEKKYKNVDFLGFTHDEQLAWLYENCRAYVFPSFMEGFGLPPLEAMIYGAPVVSSNASCLPEILGDAAHFFEPSDITDMAKKISNVLDDSALRHRLVERGHKQAQKYSWRRMAEQTLEIYSQALKK